MAISTLGGADIAGRVDETIQRRGAGGTSLSLLWTAFAAGGAVLAGISLFSTWYAAARTANGLSSGWLPPIALVLVIAGGLVLVAKQFGIAGENRRVNVDLFTFGTIAVATGLLMLNQILKSDLSNIVYLLIVPFLFSLYRLTQRSAIAGEFELEQIALGLATFGGSLILLKITTDSEYLANGYVWGLIGALVVILSALAACQYLGVVTMFQAVLFLALAISTVILLVLINDVVTDGWPVLTDGFSDFWNGVLRSKSEDPKLGISQGIMGSFWIAVFVVVLAFPIGIAAAVYLEEYAPRNWFTSTLDIVVRNLAGVPSVVYGLLGLFLFVKSVAILDFLLGIANVIFGGIHNFFFNRGWGLGIGAFEETYSDVIPEAGQSTLFAGGVTLAILVLPIVIITAAEAVRAVPQSLREGAFGVGATKWEVIKSQVLPFAAPGILTGTLLALARAVGEAAPLILVGAITGRLAPRDSIFSGLDAVFGQFADRFTAMPIVIVDWVQESGRDGGFGPAAGAAIVVLLVFVVAMNSVAVFLRNYFEKKRA